MIPLLSAAVAACLAVGAASEQITAGEMAAVYPPMAELIPSTIVAHAPEPGVSRVFRAIDLSLLATRFGLPVSDREFCVERPVAMLDPSRVRAAMAETLPGARITILEYSRQPAPVGSIEFPREGLHEGTQRAGSLWMGAVHYGGSRRFTVWARVQVAATVHRVIALGDLRPEHAIEAGQVIEQTRDEFPAAGRFAEAATQVAGKWPRISIRAGAEIRMEQLHDPKDVARGETVRVEAAAGAARIEFTGVAESSGTAGESVLVRNPESGKRFRARVEGKGRVSVNSNSSKAAS